MSRSYFKGSIEPCFFHLLHLTYAPRTHTCPAFRSSRSAEYRRPCSTGRFLAQCWTGPQAVCSILLVRVPCLFNTITCVYSLWDPLTSFSLSSTKSLTRRPHQGAWYFFPQMGHDMGPFVSFSLLTPLVQWIVDNCRSPGFYKKSLVYNYSSKILNRPCWMFLNDRCNPHINALLKDEVTQSPEVSLPKASDMCPLNRSMLPLKHSFGNHSEHRLPNRLKMRLSHHSQIPFNHPQEKQLGALIPCQHCFTHSYLCVLVLHFMHTSWYWLYRHLTCSWYVYTLGGQSQLCSVVL